MSTPFRWGVIGPGRIAHAFGQALAVVPEACLYAVASTNLERGKSFAQQYGAEKVYTDYASLIADPAVEGIYIANPHRYHFEVARQCLAAGKPVLCEKPLTVTAREAQALITLAGERQVFLMEAVWSRFQPVWLHVKRWLREGQIGTIEQLVSHFCGRVARNVDDRLLNPELAGGVLLDMGIYNLTLSKYVMGCAPDSVTADVVVGPTGVDEQTAGILRFGDVVALFNCSFIHGAKNDFTIFGETGRIVIDEGFWAATSATLYRADGTMERFEQPFDASGFEYEIAEAVRCIRAGLLESPVIPWADTLNTMTIMDQILGGAGVNYAFAPR